MVILSAGNKPTDRSHLIPRFFQKRAVCAEPYLANADLKRYHLFGNKFASLMDEKALKQHQSCLLEIDISDEISLMKQDCSLEITVPVLGVTDLLGQSIFSKAKQSFANVVGINGFGAKESETLVNNFPHPDFVAVTDIAGNKYEIIINQDGMIELPQDGTGMFSLISSITFIYSERQVLQGDGLENMQSSGFKAGKLYLLPPAEMIDAFNIKVCVTKIDKTHRRIVNSIRSIHVKYKDLSLDDIQKNISVNFMSQDISHALTISLALLMLKTFALKHPMSLTVSLEPHEGVDYSLTSKDAHSSIDANGWSQHPLDNHVFTKHIGLSENAFTQLVHQLYNEYDAFRDYLKGDNFTLSHENGFNNFLLRPEAFSHFYDFFVEDLINQRIDGSFLFDRVSTEHLLDLDMTVLGDNFHDSVVLSQLQSDIAEHRFDHIKNLFYSEDNQYGSAVNEHFDVFAQGLTKMPTATLSVSDFDYSHHIWQAFDISDDNTLFNIGTDVDTSSNFIHIDNAKQLGYFEDNFHLGTKTPPSIIQLHDVMDFADASSGIDLNQMLESQASWTPLMASSAQSETSIAMTIQAEAGEPILTTSVIRIDPLTPVDIDPSHIHTQY